MATDPLRLRRVFGGPAWLWLRERLRRLLAEGRPLPSQCTLATPHPDQRAAANRLLARPGATGPLRIKLAELTELLREAGLCDSLPEALEICDGPIPDQRRARQTWRALWSEIDAAARQQLDDPHQQLPELAAQGLWQRLSAGEPEQARRWITALATIQQALATGPWQLAELAAVTCGDAHALDRGSPLGRLTLRLQSGPETASDILAWRRTWQSLGVQVPETSGAALCLGLPWRSGPLAAAWNAHAACGEPLRIGAGALERAAVPDPPPVLLVCENPSLVEIAARRLPTPPPMICVEGQPSAAVLLLLEIFAASQLRYHGDFDWAGIHIANSLRQRFPHLEPWRYDAATLHQHDHLPGPPLQGIPCAADWDPALAPLLARRGRALHEEQVITDLLPALARIPHDPRCEKS